MIYPDLLSEDWKALSLAGKFESIHEAQRRLEQTSITIRDALLWLSTDLKTEILLEETGGPARPAPAPAPATD